MTEAELRRARSEQGLRRAGTRVTPNLPLLETEAKARLRRPQDVANRLLCLVFVSAWASKELDREVLRAWARQEPFGKRFTPDERAFVKSEGTDERVRINMSWQIEAALVLVWALTPGVRMGLSLRPRRPWEVLKRVPLLGADTSKFVASAKLKPKAQILDETDLVYCAHWAARDALLHERSLPSNWEYGVIRERHRALNWLTCYGADEGDDPWDMVTTDT